MIEYVFQAKDCRICMVLTGVDTFVLPF